MKIYPDDFRPTTRHALGAIRGPEAPEGSA